MKWAPAIIAVLFVLPPPAWAAGYGGAVQYNLRHRDGEGDRATTLQATTLELRGNAALWREWFARMDGTLRLTETRVESGDRESDRDLATGSGALSLFPRSQFPFRAFVDRTDSRVDSSIGTDTDRRATTYGFSQRYFGEAGGRYGLEYRRRRVEQVGIDGRGGAGASFDTEVLDEQLDLSAQRRFGRHELGYDFDSSETNQVREPTASSTQAHVLSHQFSPEDVELSVSNRASRVVTEREDAGPFDERDRRRQFTSTASWRPDTERPSRVTANALWRGSDLEGTRELERSLSSLRVRGTYDWTDSLSLGGSTSITDESDGGRDELRSEQQTDLRYRPAGLQLGRFVYDWSGSGVVGNRTSSEAPSVQRVAANLGHTLSRRARLADGSSVVWRLSQRGQAAEESRDEGSRSLSHSLSGTWSRSEGSHRMFVQGRLTDNRQFGERQDVFQLANLQASSNTRLSEVARFSGDVTLQASRRVDKDVSPHREDTNYATSADLVYRTSRLLEVNRLGFRSELSYRSDSFLGLAEERSAAEERAAELSWTNRLDYRIGRLDLRAESEVTRRDDDVDYQLFFTVRRDFGDA